MEHVQIVTIGNEVLSGLVVNTNAAYLSRELDSLGLRVNAIHTLPDDVPSLKNGLKHSLNQAQLVICTGGLGPTCDDNTKEVAAELMDSRLHLDEAIAAELRQRFGDTLASLQNQATIPDKAIVLPNPHGTAPGFIFESEQVTLILLPGVPMELHLMFEQSVKPYLKSKLPKEQERRTTYVLIPNTPENDVDPLLRQMGKQFSDLDIGIYARAGMITAAFTYRPQAKAHCDAAVHILTNAFPDRAIVSHTGRIEEDLQHRFVSQKWTLCLAESCTGGAIATKLTSVAGASNYFLGSVVSYSNSLKAHLLGVGEQTLHAHGAVSEETALEMARGALATGQSDFGLAVTGIAGPSGGTPQKPVGTIWIACAHQSGKAAAWKHLVRGNRARIIESTVNKALCHLWLFANKAF
jgi:nicotinamide-nucleotide amidase